MFEKSHLSPTWFSAVSQLLAALGMLLIRTVDLLLAELVPHTDFEIPAPAGGQNYNPARHCSTRQVCC